MFTPIGHCVASDMMPDANVEIDKRILTTDAGRHLLVRRARMSVTVKIVYQHISELRSKALFLLVSCCPIK